MSHVRNIVALLLLAIWPAISAHPVLEHFGLIHEAHTDHDADSDGSHDHDDDHAVADGSCLLTLAKVKVPPSPDTVAQLLVFYISTQRTFDPLTYHQAYGLAPPGTAPPLLITSWQFLSRTALSARAPSFIS